MGVNIYKDVEELMHELAKAICRVAKESIEKRDQFNFVLSGGSSPKKLYSLLASESYREKINWDKTYFFFGDERFVPEHDPQRNSLMAQETLFDPLNISRSKIFKVDTTGSPEEAARKYENDILNHFGSSPVEFDFILLGIGDNAHTASLFPNTSVLKVTDATVKSIFVDELDMFRITMTAPMINDARHIAFLVYGKDKADAVYEILEGKDGTDNKYPARLINSHSKNVQWYLDSEAASSL